VRGTYPCHFRDSHWPSLYRYTSHLK
jgi:hypothetical protein